MDQILEKTASCKNNHKLLENKVGWLKTLFKYGCYQVLDGPKPSIKYAELHKLAFK